MKINIRGRRAYLYRRRWIRASQDLPVAHPIEDYLGAIPTDAQAIPAELKERLTADEQVQLHQKILLPAAAARAAAAQREREPGWRIQEAARLLSEAAERSESVHVFASQLAEVKKALGSIKVFESNASRAAASPPPQRTDKLADALVAVKAAAESVRNGDYGKAPAEGARSTRAYRLWSEIQEAFESGERSLLRSLQEKGFVKTRKVS